MATLDEHLADIDKQLTLINKELQNATLAKQAELHNAAKVLIRKKRELLGQS